MRHITFKNKNNYSFILILPIIVLFVFIASTIYSSIHLAMVGDGLVRLDREENDLLKSNRELSLEIIKSTSLSQLSGKSQDLGFFKPSNILYTKVEESVAKLP